MSKDKTYTIFPAEKVNISIQKIRISNENIHLNGKNKQRSTITPICDIS